MLPTLLTTKLNPPAIPAKWVQRQHLNQRLCAGLEAGRRMTLVSAPAGFGKTVCVSSWLNELDCPVAWLSLDAADDDPGRFFTYFLAALQGVDEHLGREIARLLRAGQLPPAEIISTTLINDIVAVPDHFVLVLDDFQVIQDNFILEVLQTLVANHPPPLHLVLLTREEPSLPLVRLRASNQLTEIRARNLRFSQGEVEQFLAEVMGLSLSADDVATLGDKTEGWAVGLQLAGLSMQGRDNPADLITHLSGSHRHILSYLTEEVLNRQPPDIQTFLLQTSILDNLNGDLCNAVCFSHAETPDSSAGTAVTDRTDSHHLLEHLLDANLFLIPLDDEGQWYRYHQLFADLLRERLKQKGGDEVATLHRRASRWFAQANRPNEAIAHALAAEDYEIAVQLIERHARDMLLQWHKKTVQEWMQAIPLEWAAHSPRTNLAFIWLYLLGADYTQAFPYLERLQAMFAETLPDDDSALLAEWLALQATLLNAQGQAVTSLALAAQAQNVVAENDYFVRSMIYSALAGAYQQLDDYEMAVEAYQKLIQYGRSADNLIPEMIGIAGLGLLAMQHGQLYFAFEIASQGAERVERSGSLPLVSQAVYGELGSIHYQWYQLDEAHKHFQRAEQIALLSGYPDAELYYDVIRSRLALLAGDMEGAAREIQKAVDLMQVEAPAAVREEVVSQQVRVYLALDRPTAAESALQAIEFTPATVEPPVQPFTHPLGMLYNSVLRILLYRGRHRKEIAALQDGITLADTLIDETQRSGYMPLALEALLLRAQMQIALGDEQAGLEDVAAAVEMAEPENCIAVFLEEGTPMADILAGLLQSDHLGAAQHAFVEKTLAAFPFRASASAQPAHSTGSAAFVEHLTERELDVLRLMAEGLKYQEIADRIYVSLNTVRSHVKAIYGKLGVNNRTQAIEMAQRLGIF